MSRASVLLCSLAWGADARLEGLRAVLVPMRTDVVPAAGAKVRGATPKLTVVKHEVRVWIEARMRGLPAGADGKELMGQLNRELRDARLTCGWEPPDDQCPAWWRLGWTSN